MISLDSNGKQSSELMELIKKFPTSAFLAGRLQEVGWGSDYGESLLNHFREELLQECGKKLSEVLERFRAFKPSFPMMNGQVLKALPYRFLRAFLESSRFGCAPPYRR